MPWTAQRFQNALASRRGKVRRLPRAAEPIALVGSYAARINIMRASMMASVRKFVVPVLEEIAAAASRVATTDSAKTDSLPVLDARKNVGDAIDEARRDFERKWPRPLMRSLVEPIAREVPTFNARQLNKQLSAAIGDTISLDIVGSEAWIAHAAAEWTNENVALIKSIPDQFFPELEKYLTREVADGARWEELAATIEERYGVTASRAELIARDQVGKFNGDLNRVRQTDLGVTKFIWRTMGDERVRTDETAGNDLGHVERNGKTYEWSDPPEGETPGEPIQCRCYAEPVAEVAA